MPFDPDDARLTAYVLGELHEADLVEFELLVAESTDAQRFVEETRTTAGLLAEQLRHEAHPGLAPEQHHAIEKTLEMRAKSPHQFRPSRPWLTLGRFAQLAVTAGIIVFVAALVLPAYKVARERPPQLVLSTNPLGADTFSNPIAKVGEDSLEKSKVAPASEDFKSRSRSDPSLVHRARTASENIVPSQSFASTDAEAKAPAKPAAKSTPPSLVAFAESQNRLRRTHATTPGGPPSAPALPSPRRSWRRTISPGPEEWAARK